jgi:hypothetical protein
VRVQWPIIDAAKVGTSLEGIKGLLSGPVQRALNDMRAAFQSKISFRENLFCSIVECELEHGVAGQFPNTGFRPIGFIPIAVVDADQNPLQLAGDLKFDPRPLGGDGKLRDGFYGLTARFDQSSTETIGDTVESFVARNTIAVTSTIAFNITSISLTPGKWLITALNNVTGNLTGTVIIATIGTVSASISGNIGQNRMQDQFMPNGSDKHIIVPAFIVTPTVTTTYYLNGQVNYTVGTATAGGNMVATRLACGAGPSGTVTGILVGG